MAQAIKTTARDEVIPFRYELHQLWPVGSRGSQPAEVSSKLIADCPQPTANVVASYTRLVRFRWADFLKYFYGQHRQLQHQYLAFRYLPYSLLSLSRHRTESRHLADSRFLAHPRSASVTASVVSVWTTSYTQEVYRNLSIASIPSHFLGSVILKVATLITRQKYFVRRHYRPDATENRRHSIYVTGVRTAT